MVNSYKSLRNFLILKQLIWDRMKCLSKLGWSWKIWVWLSHSYLCSCSSTVILDGKVQYILLVVLFCMISYCKAMDPHVEKDIRMRFNLVKMTWIIFSCVAPNVWKVVWTRNPNSNRLESNRGFSRGAIQLSIESLIYVLNTLRSY